MNTTKLAIAKAIMDRIVNGTRLDDAGNHNDDSFDVIAARTTDTDYAASHCKQLHKMASNWLDLPDDFDEPFDNVPTIKSIRGTAFVLMNLRGEYGRRIGNNSRFDWITDLSDATIFSSEKLSAKDDDILRREIATNKIRMIPVTVKTSTTVSLDFGKL